MKIQDGKAFEKQDVFGIGALNDTYARYLTGRSCLKPLTVPGDARCFWLTPPLSRAAADTSTTQNPAVDSS